MTSSDLHIRTVDLYCFCERTSILSLVSPHFCDCLLSLFFSTMSWESLQLSSALTACLKPEKPISPLFHLIFVPLFFTHSFHEKNISSCSIILKRLQYLFVFQWIPFSVCNAVEATIFHSCQWNPGDNQYDMPNNRTQWFEFNTLDSRITNAPVSENRYPPHQSGAHCKEGWNYI